MKHDYFMSSEAVRRDIRYIGVREVKGGGASRRLTRRLAIAGETRQLLRPLLELALAFNTDQNHSGLNHDCTVFALAHLTGDPQANLPFYQTGPATSFGIRIAGFKIAPQPISSFDPSQTSPGDVLMTSGSTPEEMANGIVSGSHYTMIRASCDRDSPPIYVSKFGVDGPAIAHTLNAALYNRPAVTIGVIAGLERVQLV